MNNAVIFRVGKQFALLRASSQFDGLYCRSVLMSLLLVVINFFLKNEICAESPNVLSIWFSLHLQIQTWEKDSHGLYDYEATKLNKENFEIQGPCKVFRNWYRKNLLMQRVKPLSYRMTRSKKDNYQMSQTPFSLLLSCATTATVRVTRYLFRLHVASTIETFPGDT